MTNYTMHSLVEQYVEQMREDGSLSALSQDCYERDIRQHLNYLLDRGITAWGQVENRHLQAYWQEMKRLGKAPKTMTRSMVSLRAFYKFLWRRGQVSRHLAADEQLVPTSSSDSPPLILRTEEMEALLQAPDPMTTLGIRDLAMLEMLYATGARVSEMLGLLLEHVQLDMGFVRLTDASLKERIVPLGPIAVEAVQRYLASSRPKLATASERPVDSLFLNSRGARLSRQGFWKLLKGYARQAGIAESLLSPHTIRHSFTVHMLDNGADPRSLQELLGHSDTHFIQKYMPHLKEYRLKEVYERAHPRSGLNLASSAKPRTEMTKEEM
ncbi:tyrosine-type recombinase/integrase [Paenibacillus senegalensis]|uniref:tyrosine-type recombinase/integrase n=1 Tax=Paenibacillus senegalensis TaxID=1465766 RepID=UPI00138AADCC|nr:tyrosine-type recombinase/integrase [Paenibacillus senegalensis]